MRLFGWLLTLDDQRRQVVPGKEQDRAIFAWGRSGALGVIWRIDVLAEQDTVLVHVKNASGRRETGCWMIVPLNIATHEIVLVVDRLDSRGFCCCRARELIDWPTAENPIALNLEDLDARDGFLIIGVVPASDSASSGVSKIRSSR